MERHPTADSLPTERRLDYLRAERASGCAAAAAKLDKTPFDRYRGELRGLPGRLARQGLPQTLAFLLSSENDPDRILAGHLASWLGSNDCPVPATKTDPKELLNVLVDKKFSPDARLLAEREAVAFASMLKRFVEAYRND